VAPLKSIGAEEIHAAIERLATAIAQRHARPDRLLLLGIANGGVPLARRLAARLSARAGTLDISFHRDDIGRNPIPKEFAPTHIPGNVDGATAILVDDVLFSGRTVRAALDAVNDLGRPAIVRLAVLVDRGHRELPIRADHVGKNLPTARDERVNVMVREIDGEDAVVLERARAGEPA
jgi:pyrimidine operon attenuation protein/uracil phosphoribosyltransferase